MLTRDSGTDRDGLSIWYVYAHAYARTHTYEMREASLSVPAVPQAAPRRAKTTPREAMLLQALNEELDDREARITATTKHIQVGAKIGQYLAREDGVRQRFYAKLGDVNQPRHAYQRARESLTRKRLIGSAEGVLWLAD